jgi:hypothetical protein
MSNPCTDPNCDCFRLQEPEPPDAIRYTVTVTPDLYAVILGWLGETFSRDYKGHPPTRIANFLVEPYAFGVSRTIRTTPL